MKKALRNTLTVVMAAICAMSVAPVSAQAATMPYRGTVDCAGKRVVGIWVEQPGNSGWAQYEQTSIAGWNNVSWHYNLNMNASYRLHIGCGGGQSNWQTNNKTPWVTGNRDFVCIPGRYCVLS